MPSWTDESRKMTKCFCEMPENKTFFFCEFYFFWVEGDKYRILAISYFISAYNSILPKICIILVDWVGYATESLRLKKATYVTFYVQFINSAFLSLISFADMSEQPISFGLPFGYFVRTNFPDFDSGWFRSVGAVFVTSAIFNIYYPILEVTGFWGLRVFFRCLDYGCCKCKSGKTKSTSIQGYISVY